ncbi:MAG: DUF2059 domain-containing protein [Nitrospirae bacterium]|nr:DUF2059 domain-containing protein [Nitrospirota bacterium]
MRLFLGVLVNLLFVLCSFAYPDEASHRAAAEKLIELMHTKEVVGQLYGQMEQVLDRQFIKMEMPDSERPVLKRYKNILLIVLEAEIDWEKVKDDFIETYTNRYTEDELKAMAASYNAPAGQEFLDRMPMLMQEEIIISQKKIPGLMNKTQQINVEMIDELRARQLKKNQGGSNRL